VIGQIGACARIIGLLRFPSDDPGFDINLPATRPGAVHTMSRADDFVVPPPVAIRVFPIAVLTSDLTVTIRKLFQCRGLEEIQSIEQMAHIIFLYY
jgi:hypothetical protein